jgi:hypothetical protein
MTVPSIFRMHVKRSPSWMSAMLETPVTCTGDEAGM